MRIEGLSEQKFVPRNVLDDLIGIRVALEFGPNHNRGNAEGHAGYCKEILRFLDRQSQISSCTLSFWQKLCLILDATGIK